MEDLTNKRFGRLTVLQHIRVGKGKCYCICDCGKYKEVRADHLYRGLTQSCGCLKAERTSIKNKKHGECMTSLYGVWSGIKARCHNPRSTNYKNYGKRHIRVCDEWMKDFESFSKWAKENGYKKGLTIDRINVDGNYEPNNCRWVDNKTQCRNKRNNVLIEFNGNLLTMAEVAEKLNIKYHRFVWRYKNGKTFDEIISMG